MIGGGVMPRFDEISGRWFDEHGRRIGAQRPRLESVPPRVDSLLEMADDLMQLVGKPLDEWQKYVLSGALGLRGDGRWSAFEVGVCVPRQCGKNVIIEARELIGMFILGDKTTIHSAHQFRTARKSFREMEKLIRETPSLFSQVLGYKGQGAWDDIKGIRVNGAEMSIELLNGCKLEYQARSKGGGRGFTGDLIVLDEAYDLSMDEIAAMMPTMAARSMDGNPQIWYTSSAGMPDSYALADIRERGTSGDSSRLAYYEWSAEDDADSTDVDAWYQANPGLGIRISEEYVRETELPGMENGGEKFRRERMGILAQIGGDSVIPSALWRRCLDPESEPGERLAFAVDVPPSRDMATVAAVSDRGDGVWHVSIVAREEGTAWVPERLRELKEKWSPVAIVLDEGSAAGALLPDVKRARVRTVPLNMRQYGQACAAVYDAVRQGKLAHVGYEDLDRAVAAAQMKAMGESLWKWDRKTQVADISPLIAVTHAWHGLTSRDRAPSTERTGRAVGRRPVGRAAVGRG